MAKRGKSRGKGPYSDWLIKLNATIFSQSVQRFSEVLKEKTFKDNEILEKTKRRAFTVS